MSVLILPGRGARGQRPSGPAVLNRHSPQARGLVAWFPFGHLQDSAGPIPLSVSRSGSPALSGASLGGLALTGANSNTASLEAAYHTAWASIRVFTVAAWVWWDGDTTGFGGILSNYNPNPGFYLRRQNGGDKFQFATANESSVGTSTNAIPSKRWCHLVGTVRDNAAGFQDRVMYLDGVQDNTLEISAATSSYTDALRIGNDYIAGFSRGWGGQIADIRLWTRGMTAQEVWALYDPATRWDLYWVPGRTIYFDAGAAVVAGMRNGYYLPLLGVA